MFRRDFIKYSSATLGLSTQTKFNQIAVFAQNQHGLAVENDNILVLVQLFGGNDGLNTIIPVEIDSYYSKYRPKLQIRKSEALKITNTDLAMHPALRTGVKEGLYGLQKEGKLAIIQGIGYDNPSFSHFRSMDIWLSGIAPVSETQVLETGFLGRYYENIKSGFSSKIPFAIHVGHTPSLVFQGVSGSSAVMVEDPQAFYEQGNNVISERTKSSLSSYYGNEYNFIKDIALQSNTYSKVIKEAFDKGKNAENYPDKSLANQLKLVARLISGGLGSKVYFVGMSGFDTHSGQGGVGGIHAQLLATASEAIAAFVSDIEKLKLADKVTGLTISEFGRRPEENEGLGTDHGTAGVMFAFGNNVKNKIYGKPLLSTALGSDQNFIHQFDYKQVYFETLATWFGANQDDVKKVLEKRYALIEDGIFKTTKPEDFAGKNPPLVTLPTESNADTFEMLPNPVIYEGLLRANLTKESSMLVRQYTLSGTFIGELFKARYVESGLNMIPVKLEGGSGMYLLEIFVNDKPYHLRVVKM